MAAAGWNTSTLVGRKLVVLKLSTDGARCVMFQQSLSPQYHNVTVAESLPVGTVILEIQATDGDEPATGSSYIIYQVKEGDPNNTFIIETDPETNRGFVKINKVNRWVYSFPFIYTYIYIYICINSNRPGDDLRREGLAGDGVRTPQAWCRLQEAPLLGSGIVPVQCLGTPILPPLLSSTHPLPPAAPSAGSAAGPFSSRAGSGWWSRSLGTIKKKKGIIWVILQQCFWKRESQLNVSMGCGCGGGLSRGRLISLLVLWAVGGFCNGRCKWDQHVSMSGWRDSVFLLRQTLTTTKPRSVRAAMGDTSHMLNAGDRNIRNTCCCIHEFQ